MRAAVLFALLLLGLVLSAWHLQRFSTATALLALALLLAPWLLVSGGLWRYRPQSYRSSVLLLVPYLAYGIMERVANPGARTYATATLVACLLLFVALVAFLRVSRPR